MGGAESSLLNLLKNNGKYNNHVISLAPLGITAERMQELCVVVESLNMSGKNINTPALYHLIHLIRNGNSDIVHCWMYHANLIGGLAAKIVGLPVIWGIHHDSLDPTLLKRRTIWIAKSGAYLSRWLPDKIIFCAESSMKKHLEIGYDAKKSCVIPNGFNNEIFKPDQEARLAIRKELGIPPDALVVGHVGRFDPTKDHHSMVKAVGLVAQKTSGTYFIFCGHGVDARNEALAGWIKEAGIDKCTRLLGVWNDMARVYSSMDVYVSSSVSEAFPNVIGEAMACGVPCVVTDVGDSALIVGDTGKVVPPKNPQALAENIIAILCLPLNKKCELGRRARKRIIENFEIKIITRQYEDLYETVLLNTSD